MLPTVIQKLNDAHQISTFSNFSMIVTQKGSVLGFGSNMKGRIGIDKIVNPKNFDKQDSD